MQKIRRNYAKQLTNDLLGVLGECGIKEIPPTVEVSPTELQFFVKEGRGFLHKARVRDIINGWNPILFGVLLVSRRPDGTLAVIDGNHRLDAALQLELQWVPAIIVNDLTTRQEHAAFALGQTCRKNLNAKTVFRQALEAGCPTARGVDAVVRRHGFRITRYGGSSGNSAIDGVTELQRIYGRQGGKAILERILRTVSRAWGPTVSGRTNVRILRGLDYLFAYANGEIDEDRLVEKFSRDRPSRLWINALDGTGKSVAASMAVVYNHKLRNRRIELPVRDEK